MTIRYVGAPQVRPAVVKDRFSSLQGGIYQRADLQFWRSRGFTLVELLVVIFVISVLAALLLPALQSSIYAARKIACMNNCKQLAAGLLVYANESGNYYPSAGTRPRMHGGQWDGSLFDMSRGNYWGKLIRPYWGGEPVHNVRAQIEDCALLPRPLPHGHWSSYLYYCNFTRENTSNPDNYISKPMRKVGQEFRTRKEYSWGITVLLSDVFANRGGSLVNHNERIGAFTENTHWYFQYRWSSPGPQPFTGHFAGQDGAVRQYRYLTDPSTNIDWSQHVPNDYID